MNYLRKTILRIGTIWVIVTISIISVNAQRINQELEFFNKVIVSPRIDVELVKGEKERIDITYDGVVKKEINIVRRGKTLRLYLDHARISEKQVVTRYKGWVEKRPRYEHAEVKAVITYTSLKHIQIRGEQEVNCPNVIASDKLRIKQFGENKLAIAGVKTNRLKISLFGENEIDIKEGETKLQIVKLFGQNDLDTRNVFAVNSKASSLGESRIHINSSQSIKVMALGESTIYFEGGGEMYTGLVLGENKFVKVH